MDRQIKNLLGGVLLAVIGWQVAPAGAVAATSELESGIERQTLDENIRPQDDFYQYVNGKWLAATAIPADRPDYDSFGKLDDENQLQLRQLVEAAAASKNAAPGSEEQKIGQLYTSFMDESALEGLGAKGLAQELAGIEAIKDKRALPALWAHLQRLAVTVPFAASVTLDHKDASHYALTVDQDGLGLPDRDYYLLHDDATLKKILDQYRQHVAASLRLLGDRNAEREAADIVALETRIAKVQWTKVQNRDPIKTYNKVAIAELKNLTGDFAWHRYLQDAGADGKISYVIVSQPSYLQGLSGLLAAAPLPVWKSYLRWHLLSAYSPYLSRAFVDEDFAFNGKVLQGTAENRPRWKRGVALVDGDIGEALGKLYVARYFPPQSKARADELVRNLLEAYRQDIGSLAWMSPDTRTQALAKLSKISTKIGYPSQWRDYSALQFNEQDLVGNVMRAHAFEFQRNINKLGQPVDRTEWDLTPQTVNAYYNPEMNEIVFPAAILQPPFFNPRADDAVNYGAIGMVIGHEISHGFDDEGSQYDGDGNLRDWWTADDHARYAARTQALVAEYSAFEPVPGYHLNGQLTLGENIADNSGLAIAYKAYGLSLGGQTSPVLDGLTGEQRLYVGFARIWWGKQREAYAIELIKADPHSLSADRVIGTLANQPGFFQAFDVKPGDKMYVPPDQRVLIW
ncbi:MAG TPA: M13 family metallopeptidase [Steroidobacteraceae bacterium]|nr:M13 family metallopeptidase [Steroidobacteraceae bacterium]